MEPTKPTKSTQKTGENKPTNIDLLRQMIKISNNSVLTNQLANLLSNKLDKIDMIKLIEWLKHANREQEHKNNGKQLGFGNPNIKRW